MADGTGNHQTSPTSRGGIPRGLTASMVTIGCSLAIIVILWNLRWPTPNPMALVVHASAALCLGWSLLAHLLSRINPRWAASLPGRDVLAVLQITQLLLGLVAFVILFYFATMAVLTRIPSLPFFSFEPTRHVYVWRTGILDLAVLAIAALLAWWRTHDGSLMTCLVWVLVLLSLWAALQTPEFAVRVKDGIPRNVLVDWVSPFVLASAAVLAGFVMIGGLLAHRHRSTAWPDRLGNLVTPLPEWPGFRYSAGVLSAMFLILGCVLISRPLTPVSSLLAGATVLTLAARRWDENFADVGLGLFTLAVVSAMCLGVSEPDPGASRAEYFASIFNRALLALAVMTFFWHWLAAVWDQQLDHGRAWTTAGAMIRPVQRVGFLVAATATLVSSHLAFWPLLTYVEITDNSASRWIWGTLANLVLISALMRSARKTGKPTLAWLMLFTVASLVSFVVIRSPGNAFYVACLKFWPLMLLGASVLLIFAAKAAGMSRAWRPFLEPTYVSGVLILPVCAIAGGCIMGSLRMPQWVSAATLAGAGAVYFLASRILGPSRFGVLTFVCAAAAIWESFAGR